MGIPEDIDFALVLKAWKILFHCVGSIKEDKKTKSNYIVLNGDHRQEVLEFFKEPKKYTTFIKNMVTKDSEKLA